MTAEQVGGFLGVSDAELRAIGCLTVAAARLEWTVRTIAADLLMPPGNQRAGDLLKAIRRAVRAGLPAHARIDPEALIDWTYAARDALNKRHVPVHSAAARQGSAPVLLHLRSGAVAPMEEAGLMASTEAITAVDAEGRRLSMGLRRTPRPGVFLPNAVVDETWIPICSTDHGGVDMARPTPNELDEWWRTYGPFPRI